MVNVISYLILLLFFIILIIFLYLGGLYVDALKEEDINNKYLNAGNKFSSPLWRRSSVG